MAQSQTQPRSRILGLGGYVPPRVVTNQDLTQWMDTTSEWIVERTGIEERRWVEPGETGAGMAAKACREAMEQAGVGPSDIDMLIYATLSPDHMFPGTGVFCQRELGLKECAVLDIRQQCTGFIYGLSIADNFIRSGMYRTILVVGSEIHSTGLDVTTNGRDVAVLFGDGAGAMVIGVSDDPAHRILSTHLHADGSDAEILWVEKPGSMYHPMITKEDIDAGKQFPKMVGKKVFKHAVTRMPQAIMEGMIANDLKLDDIDMVIPHQANLRINEMVAKMIGLPLEKMHNNIQKLGNTTAATIPLCLKDAIEQGKVAPGDLLCFVAFGAGLTWGSVLVRY
ncbi:MAG TPA: beta-ketoacyl-ACP synthase III [Kofleriaceae bacterium]|nr:beta-ketoacyl-ACP synthase III [Kofleriaceae bacterium]